MLKLKKLVFYTCLVFAFLCSSNILAMDSASDRGKDELDEFSTTDSFAKFKVEHTSPSSTSPFVADSVSPLLEGGDASTSALSTRVLQVRDEDQKTAVLENCFRLFTLNIRGYLTFRQAAGGASSIVLMALFFQSFVPMCLGALGDLGLGTNIIPDTGWPEVFLIAGAALIPLLTGSTTGFRVVTNALSSVPEYVVDAMKTATNRRFNTLEYWTYNYFIKSDQFLFWGGLFFALLMNIESNLSPSWGNPYLWGGAFGLLFVAIATNMFISSSNNPNENPNRSLFESSKDQKQLKNLITAVDDVQALIKNQGLTTEVESLGQKMNAILSPLSVEPTTAINPSDEEDGQPRLIPSSSMSTEPTQLSMADLRAPREPKYVSVFKSVIIASKKLPPYVRTWNRGSETLAKWVANASQLATIPARGIFTYGLLYIPQVFLGADPKVAMGISIAATIVSIPFHFLAANKEVVITSRGLTSTFRLCEPQRTAGQWFGRAPSILAPIAAFFYVGLPVEYYSRHTFLPYFGISNLPAQLVIMIPLISGVIMPAATRFFGTTFETISNWIVTGAEVDLFGCCRFKILCCVDTDRKRYKTLEVFGRLEDIKKVVRQLSPEYLEHLHSQLEAYLPKISLGEDERTPILAESRSRNPLSILNEPDDFNYDGKAHRSGGGLTSLLSRDEESGASVKGSNG